MLFECKVNKLGLNRKLVGKKVIGRIWKSINGFRIVFFGLFIYKWKALFKKSIVVWYESG